MNARPIIPAPLWRRLAAASYDALLFFALLIALTWVLVIATDLSHAGLPRRALQGIYFFAGLGFFGVFWTHSGQTLGMRAWRLKLRRSDGAEVRWPIAALRYAAAWFSWISVVGVLWCLADPQRRAWHDIIAGTEVVVMPPSPPTPLPQAGEGRESR